MPGVLYISERVNENLRPRPPWGRGWTATRAFTSGAGRVRGSKPNVLNPKHLVVTTPSLAIRA
jgi:hypothetical protein